MEFSRPSPGKTRGVCEDRNLKLNLSGGKQYGVLFY